MKTEMMPGPIPGRLFPLLRQVLGGVLIGGIQGYRWVLSPLKVVLLGDLARCRFQPSCSAYALEAIVKHGPIAGTGLAVRRVCRCHPWGGQGLDPVPE